MRGLNTAQQALGKSDRWPCPAGGGHRGPGKRAVVTGRQQGTAA
ncbi:hypothetical protein [uncultured Corynebacterium sp.]|nr:hypothetical protein [uncultured Corynebacterium sp.]